MEENSIGVNHGVMGDMCRAAIRSPLGMLGWAMDGAIAQEERAQSCAHREGHIPKGAAEREEEDTRNISEDLGGCLTGTHQIDPDSSSLEEDTHKKSLVHQ